MPENIAEAAWCRGSVPDRRTELPVIQSALSRMRAIDGTCAALAYLLDTMLAHGRLRLYDPSEHPGAGGLAPVGFGADSYLLLSRDFVTTYPDEAHRSANVDSRGVPRPETLQLVLAHEADHLAGVGHVDVDGYLTPNALRCSDLH